MWAIGTFAKVLIKEASLSGYYKTFRGNIGRTLTDINHCTTSVDPSPRVMEIKTKINKRDLIDLKSFSKQRKPQSKRKDNLQNGIKYSQMM